MFLSQLDENDYLLLETNHYKYINRLTENASADSIDAYFEYDQIERDGLMSVYNDVYRYADQLIVTIRNKQYLLMDQYCLLPGCPCSDTILSINEIRGVNEPNDDFPISLNYKNKEWKEPEGRYHSFQQKP